MSLSDFPYILSGIILAGRILAFLLGCMLVYVAVHLTDDAIRHRLPSMLDYIVGIPLYGGIGCLGIWLLSAAGIM